MEKRIQRLQDELNTGEAFLIMGSASRYYLTGFMTSDGIVLITRQHAWFLTDFRYIEKAKDTVKSCEVRLSNRFLPDAAELLKNDGITAVFPDTETVSVQLYERICREIAGAEILRTDRADKLLEKMRSIKSSVELEKIRAAQQYTDATFSYILERLEEGRTERDVMLDMEFYMRRLGSEGVAFDFIVVSGKNSSLPHGVPTDKKLEKGDLITMDFGARVDGYCSDMTRTVALGSVTDEQRRVYDLVLNAQLAAIETAGPGISCREIDAVARNMINSGGYEGCFGHGLGHSVGIEIHESPCFNMRCGTLTEPGMVITVEPGIYLDGRFGVRIEDMICITETGTVNLTNSTKELIIL